MDDLPPALDPGMYGQLRELEAAGSPGFLADLTRQFLAQAAAQLDLIRGHIQGRDGDGLHRSAHLLKGSAGSLGALPLMELLRSLEGAGLARDWAQAEGLLPRIEAEFGRVKKALETAA